MAREFPLELKEGIKHQMVAVVVPDANSWSPSSPVLYRAIAQLIGPDGNVSQISEHFGIRKIEARGRAVGPKLIHYTYCL
jgi:beta-galactosidase/beta-glucuronidase